MASITLKNIPEELLEKLRHQAESDRRSLQQEILFLLEQAADPTQKPIHRSSFFDFDLEEKLRRQYAELEARAGK